MFSNLKAAIQAVIKTNGNQSITGAVMQSSLISMINGLGANMQFMGVANSGTNPGVPDGPVFYIATQAGTYSNFGGIRVSTYAVALAWGRPGSVEDKWEALDLGIPTYGEYIVNKKFTDDEIKKKADAETVNAELAKKADIESVIQKSSMFTGAIMNKGKFTSTDEALLTKDKPFTAIVCFVVPDTSEGSRLIAHDGYGSHDVSSYYISGYTKAYGLRASIRGVSVLSGNQSLPVGSLAQVAVSYIPDGTLTVCFNDRVIVNESPAYTREANPKETTLGGYDYEPFNAQTTIISFRKFDFAMTADQLVEAWNGGHPESWRVPDVYRNGAEGARCILDLIPESLTPTVWRDTSGQGHDLAYQPYGDNPSECGMDYVRYETVESDYKKSILYGQQTAAVAGSHKGYFKSDSPALILPDQPMTLIVVFKMTLSGIAIIYDENTNPSSQNTGEYIYAEGTSVCASVRGTSFLKTVTGSNLRMVALSYTPNGALITRINEYVDEKGAPEYANPHAPVHVRLGGWSISYVESNIISVRRFDFAMTKEQLEEAWNGGHPERWKVPDVYRNGAEGARCILDLNPHGLTPTVWRDMSSGHNDLHFYRMTTRDNSPEVCALSYEEHGFIDNIVGDKAPDMNPQFTGQEYTDRTNEAVYKAVGTTAVSKWKPL